MGMNMYDQTISYTVFLAVAVITIFPLLALGCLWCLKRLNKSFTTLDESQGDLEDVITNNEKSEATQEISDGGSTNGPVRVEPLPDIAKLNPFALSSYPGPYPIDLKEWFSKSQIPPCQDWFVEQHNFPRNKLRYIREIGVGWFGRAIEGEAQNIIEGETKSIVAFKSMKDDASQLEQMYFLYEMKVFRDLKHPNIMKVLGQCLDSTPLILILEQPGLGDLKSYLLENSQKIDSRIDELLQLRLATQLADGLNYMHQHQYLHNDLAARNCIIDINFVAKVGDFGVSLDKYKDDYYVMDDFAIPIRWLPPDSVEVSDVSKLTVTCKPQTLQANVWSFSIVMWEIFQMADTPYSHLDDINVIKQVIVERSVHPGELKRTSPLTEKVYALMRLCWTSDITRPKMAEIHQVLRNLNTQQTINNNNSVGDEDFQSFDKKWEALQPNVDNHSDDHNTDFDFNTTKDGDASPKDLQIEYESDKKTVDGTGSGADISLPSCSTPNCDLEKSLAFSSINTTASAYATAGEDSESIEESFISATSGNNHQLSAENHLEDWSASLEAGDVTITKEADDQEEEDIIDEGRVPNNQSVHDWSMSSVSSQHDNTVMEDGGLHEDVHSGNHDDNMDEVGDPFVSPEDKEVAAVQGELEDSIETPRSVTSDMCEEEDISGAKYQQPENAYRITFDTTVSMASSFQDDEFVVLNENVMKSDDETGDAD